MQNDWYDILKLDKSNINDENTALLIEYCFDDFIFKGYDENGNLILLYLKDNKEYIAILNNNTVILSLNTNYDNKSYKQYLNLSLRMHNGLYPYNKDTLLLKKYLKTSVITKNVEYSKNSSFYKIVKNRINYIYDLNEKYQFSDYGEFNCQNSSIRENVDIYTDIFYLDKNVKSKKVIPDILCSTNVDNDNGNIILTKSLFTQGFKTSDKPLKIESTLPIMYIASEEQKNFLEDNCKIKESKIKLLYKTSKIGF